ncbi:hypothetical protein N7492_004862 [Penicillium capsulatum]|uniref:Uncharacterized protein n=1 Tax=Penicillium capsulatum TaxID=69766 RepID=A0A9W9LQF4_9EURO|nr:hypothetical protein N7492_004862 [Penicillium capsulatum]
MLLAVLALTQLCIAAPIEIKKSPGDFTAPLAIENKDETLETRITHESPFSNPDSGLGDALAG